MTLCFIKAKLWLSLKQDVQIDRVYCGLKIAKNIFLAFFLQRPPQTPPKFWCSIWTWHPFSMTRATLFVRHKFRYAIFFSKMRLRCRKDKRSMNYRQRKDPLTAQDKALIRQIKSIFNFISPGDPPSFCLSLGEGGGPQDSFCGAMV